MKNMILIITDTFRYDNLDEKSERLVRTPELDKFAGTRATAIEKFFTGSFPTIPHRADFATGTLGWPHYGWQPIDQSSPNHVASILRDAGYVSQLICDCPHLFNARFQHAFDAAFQSRGQEGDRYLLRLNDPIETVMPVEKTRYRPVFQGHTLADTHRWMNRNPKCEIETFPAKTGQTAIRWLEENYKADPFFLWVDFFDPHEPWDPPEYMVERYNPEYSGIPMLHPNYGPSSDYSPEELKNLQAHYAAESEIVDRWIGRVLQKIDDLQLWDETIVVVTADHGMSIGEHGRTGKSNIHPRDDRYWPIYPEIGHVPFLIAGGDVPIGQSLDLIAQPIDILPTMCELAGAQVNPPEGFHGRSFASAILEGRNSHREYAVSGCHIRSQDTAIPAKAVTPFLVTEQWGYAPVGAHGGPELYDLTKDPFAVRDIASRNISTLKKLHKQFLEHLYEYSAPEPFVHLFKRTGKA